MKRPRKNSEPKAERPFFAQIPNESDLHESLRTYMASKLVQTAQFDPETKAYKIFKYGSMITCCGIHRALQTRYYSHYKSNRSTRKWSRTNIKGSSDVTGIRVDSEIIQYILDSSTMHRFHKYTVAILRYITSSLGHTMQAAQVPVSVFDWNVATQCDLITRDKQGELHVWEVKTGIPVGGFLSQGFFKTLRGANNSLIKCTGYTIWQLQLHFTSAALRASGVQVSPKNCHIIQVYEDRKKGLITKIHEPEPWTEHINAH